MDLIFNSTIPAMFMELVQADADFPTTSGAFDVTPNGG